MARRGHHEHGAAAVEMAFVVMLLILLATGVADLGRTIFTYIGIQDAAQEGAMFASYHPDECDTIKQRAAASIDYPQLDWEADVDVAPCPAGTDRVTVTVTHRVDLVTPVISELVGGDVELSRSFTSEVFGAP